MDGWMDVSPIVIIKISFIHSETDCHVI